MYLFTGNSDKMPFYVMKNDHVVIVCAHCGPGPQLLQSDFVFCVTLCIVVVLCVDCCVTLGNAAALVY
jgi:hypothetical protein